MYILREGDASCSRKKPIRGGIMGSPIAWETDMKTALARAASEKKPVLADFFNPE
jgi:hypothetical protein